MSAPSDIEFGEAEILDPGVGADAERIEWLRRDTGVRSVDTIRAQRTSLAEVLPPATELLDEPTRWVHYPWRSTLVHLLGPIGFRRLRLDRNRNKITLAEQDRLALLRVGVVGLSVGHVVAHTLAMEGSAGTIRLADFDHLDLSNLNRVPGSVCDLGVNKSVAAARRIAEIDPYITVEVVPGGIDAETVARFIDGLDLVLEECDSFDAKVLVRDQARRQRIPVIMETSDGGVLDVERFDREPQRPLFHGLLGDIDASAVAGLSTAQKMPLAIALLDASRVTTRMAASALELGRTIGSWPQLGGEVALGGATCAAAVRRLALGRELPSGRVRVDLDRLLDTIIEPAVADRSTTSSTGELVDPRSTFGELDDIEAVLFAGRRAPSPGNAQRWRITAVDNTIRIALGDQPAGPTDIDDRAGIVTLGMVAHNVRVAAAERSILGADLIAPTADDHRTLVVELGDRTDPTLARRTDAMLARHTNRMPGDASALSDTETAALLGAVGDVALPSGTIPPGLRVVADPHGLDNCAQLFAAYERIRYLTPALHREMVDELRLPGATGNPDTGIALPSVGLPPQMVVMLDVLRRADAMAELDAWDAGHSLGAAAAAAVQSSSALVAVVGVDHTPATLAYCGMVAEALWIRATEIGLAVCPMNPVSLYARTDAERRLISPGRAHELGELDRALHSELGVLESESVAMIVRIHRSTVRPPISRRRRY
ncbi:Rv1355c family protein [Williamsia sp. CHRR-6]|uniref:Rv1355c family protein n=1 Tax=Williamsia sp. CHRR-6 TaxID=2835871 RepID=UPI0027DCEF3C|nr:Rv1355c family protein [Williamsia sp. CHRR-6]